MNDRAAEMFAETWVLPEDELAARRGTQPLKDELARRVERLLGADETAEDLPER